MYRLYIYVCIYEYTVGYSLLFFSSQVCCGATLCSWWLRVWCCTDLTAWLHAQMQNKQTQKHQSSNTPTPKEMLIILLVQNNVEHILHTTCKCSDPHNIEFDKAFCMSTGDMTSRIISFEELLRRLYCQINTYIYIYICTYIKGSIARAQEGINSKGIINDI